MAKVFLYLKYRYLCEKNTLIKVKVPIQLFFSSKSKKVQVLKFDINEIIFVHNFAKIKKVVTE